MKKGIVLFIVIICLIGIGACSVLLFNGFVSGLASADKSKIETYNIGDDTDYDEIIEDDFYEDEIDDEVVEGEATTAKVEEEPTYLSFEIVDETKTMTDASFPSVLEEFYEDDTYVYTFSSPKSSYVKVHYSDGTEENIKDALNSGRVKPSDLDRFDIKYYKDEK